MESPSVVFFINKGQQTSFTLDLASNLYQKGLDITVCDFYATEGHPYDLPYYELNATSRTDLCAYKRFAEFLHEQNPDILHTHPLATGSLARLIGWLVGVPQILTTEHSTHTRYNILQNVVNGSTIWMNDIVIGNSETTTESITWWEDLLMDFTGTERRTVYNGVDINWVQTADGPSPGLPDGGFCIGTVSRLIPVKRQENLIKSVSILKESHEDIHLAIVGDGPERTQLERLAEKLQIQESVIFLGELSRGRVYSLLHKIDVFALLSRHEGFGNAVVEAMAAGLPVLLNDNSAFREVAGDAGIFVDGTHPEAVARELDALYRNPELRQELGRVGRDRSSQFSIEKCSRVYFDIYENLVG